MAIDLKIFKKDIDDWVTSDSGKNYFENLKIQEEIKQVRFRKFEKYIKSIDFDIFFYKILLQHNNDYRDKCYDKGCEPYPNNILHFIIDYVVENTEPVFIKKLDCSFPNQIWEFNGYYFQIIQGQGSVIKIINKDDMRELLVI